MIEELLLRRAAAWCGIKARIYGIPLECLTATQWREGNPGFVAHGDLDPDRRTYPGADFPWERFLAYCAGIGLKRAGHTQDR